jgi:hypothetical protein
MTKNIKAAILISLEFINFSFPIYGCILFCRKGISATCLPHFPKIYSIPQSLLKSLETLSTLYHKNHFFQ